MTYPARRMQAPVSRLRCRSVFSLFRFVQSVSPAAALVVSLVLSGSLAWGQQAAQVLDRHVRSAVSNHQAALLNQLPSDQQLHLSIILPLRDEAGLTSLLGRLYDPASADYRKFLSVAEFTAQFGPTQEDFDAVVAFSKASGFTVAALPANRLIVPVSGTAEQINKAFHVQMNVYQHPTEKRTFFSPDREPSLALSVPVAHISGLDDFSLPRHMAKRAQDAAQALAITGSGPGGSYLGSDMRAVYYGGSTLTGIGQTVGILEFGGYLLSDVNLTFSNAGQSNTVPINNVLLDNATGAPVGDDGEQTLDIVQAIGMAPGLSQVRVYIGVGSDDANILNSMASENMAKQLSCSWGWRPADPAAADVFFKEMAAQGQSFFTASGDSGAFDAAIDPFFYPAEDAYVTSVGGTHLTTKGVGGTWASESVWNSSGYGSGGGISPDNISIPSWQVGIASSANGGSTTLRNVPDVAMEGDFDNYACALGVCSGNYAGTSFATPRWAGFMALVNQQAVEAGTAPKGGLGFLNPPLYLIAESTRFGTDLHDTTSGNNDTGNQPLWYSAVPGYDLATGWGSPTGQSLIDDLAGQQVPGFFLSNAQSVVAVNPGGMGSVALTVTSAGGFTGSVNFAVTSTLPSGVTASFSPNPATGSTVLTLTASSTAAMTSTLVTVTGTSGTLSGTTTLTVVVHAPSFALSASPSTLGINQGASGTTTITVVPQYGFTGSVSLVASGLPSGVTAVFSPASTTGSSTLTLTVSSSATPGTSTVTITGGSGSLTATATLSLAIHGPSFSLSNGGTVSIGQGATGTGYVYVYDLYGFTGSVTLVASGLPSGVTATFSPNPTTGTSTLTLVASSAATVGQSTVTITGTSGSLSATTTLTVGVYAPTFTIYGSSSVSVGQGSSGTSYVYVSPQYGFNGSVRFSVAGLPSGVTALWSPNPTTNNSTLTLAASSSAKTGTYALTITGVSGTQTATTTLTLGVYAPTFTLGTYSVVNLGLGNSSSASVYVTPQYGFAGSVTLSIAGLPSGVTGTFSPNPTTGTSTLTLQASSTATLGQYTATITGTYGTQTATTTLSVGVYTPTFTLSSSGSVTVGRGTSSTGYVYTTAVYGFTGSVSLSASGLPAGVTATFSPNPTTYSSTLTLTASSTAALGQYTMTITGTSGTQTATTSLSVGIYNPSFTLFGSNSATVGQGTATSSYVYVTSLYGFTGSVNFAVSGLPAGVTASFSPNPTTYSSTMTLTASSTAALGQYSLTVTGTSGTQTATMALTLGIYTPSFTLTSYSGINVGQGSSATGYVYVNSQYGFAGNVSFSVSGLPSGVTAAFSPNPTAGSSALTLTASSAASVGSTTLTITGVSGTQTMTTTVLLSVSAPSFTLYSSFYNVSLNEGAASSGYVSSTGQYGFSGSVTYAAAGLPSGVTATFSPNPTPGTSTLNLAASGTATPGSSTVTITGSSGTTSATTTFLLTINAPGYTLTAAPSRISLMPGSSQRSTVTVVPVNAFAGSVSLAASGLPSGVTAAFSPASTAANSTLTLTASSAASPGTATVTLTGSSGALSASTTLALIVGGTAASTSTALALTAAGAVAASVPAGTMVTATASVVAGSTPVTMGQVNFCDATASACDVLHLIGSAQLTSAGTAVLRFVPGAGSRKYQAVFAGTTGNAASLSSVANLSVSATQATVTSVAQSGVAGNYTLKSTVTGQGPFAPAGNVSFLDTSNGNVSLGQATLASAAASFSLASAQTVAVGNGPQFSAMGDFNGDGIPDLAVVNSSSNSVSILLGKGDGTFKAASASLATASGPLFVVVGDFNRDGSADLAVASSNLGSVAIFLGNGDGSFTPANSSPQTGSSPVSMAVGDFNGDGLQDLAVVNQYSNSVTILLGNGDGSFTPSSSAVTGYYPKAIALADFNGDGVQDLAVTNTSANTVTILLGNGDGTFIAVASPATGSYPIAIAVADLNQDGKPDLIVGNESGSSATVLLGNGDGTFAAGASAAVGSYPYSLAVADFNGDGKADLVATNYYGATITTLLGNGDGTFAAGLSAPTGLSPVAVVVGDWNGDGIPDIATTNSGGNSVTVVTSALAQKATATATTISPLGQGQHAVVASYAGSGSYLSSLSAAINLTASAGPPAVTVSLSAASITTVQPLTVTIAVSGGAGNPVPTGAVTLTSGAYSSTAATLSAGSAAITIPAGSLFAGSDALSVHYAPDAAGAGAYTAATGTASVTVGKTTPAVTASLSAASITTVQPLTVTVAVNSGAGNAVPTGTVTLSSGSYTSTATALSGGSASITVPAGSFAAGTDGLSVSYAPDAASSGVYNSSTGSGTVTVAQAIPAVALSLSASSITTLQPLTVTVAVSGGTAPATGAVTLSSGSYTSSPVTLLSGGAATTIPAGTLAAGKDTLQAAYTPDASAAGTYTAASQTASVTVTVAIGTATATVTAMPSAGTITNLQSDAVTVAVAGVSGQPTPTGTVTLSSGSYSAQQTLASGTVSFTVAAGALSAGTDTLTATYSGDAVYAGRSGSTTVTVAPVILSVAPLAPIPVGSSGSGTVALLAGGNYTGTLNLSCALSASPSGAQSLPTCRLSAATLPLAAGGTASATLTVTTTAAAQALLKPPSELKWRSYGYGGPLFAAMLLLVVPARRRRFAALLAVLVMVAAGVSGCSSGGGQSTQPKTPGTTTGSYTFVVTAADSGSALTTSASVNVTVQ